MNRPIVVALFGTILIAVSAPAIAKSVGARQYAPEQYAAAVQKLGESELATQASEIVVSGGPLQGTAPVARR
jgi:hypothetical protein